MAAFISPMPDDWQNDPQKSEFMRELLLWLNDMNREGGIIDTGEETTETVVTHAEKLDFVTVTQDVNLDTTEAQAQAATTALAALLDSLPDYTITNDGTQRSLNADSAAGAISDPPTQAQVENLRNSQLVSDDVLATLLRDLGDKGIIS